MRRDLRRAVLVLFLLGIAAPARPAFQTPLISPDAAGMGGSCLAGLGDSSALFINPAGTSGLGRAEAYFTYHQMFAGLQGVGSIGQGFLSLGVPTRLGTLSLGLAQFKAENLLEERTMGVSFARRFGEVEAGVTAKYLYHRYLVGSDPAADDPVFQNGTSKGALGLDAGLIATVAAPLKIGLAARNINRPDVGLAVKDPVARELQAGAAYELASFGMRFAADFTYRAAPAATFRQRSVFSIGFEKKLDRVKFRAGASPDNFSSGVGIEFGDFGFDYAFVFNRELRADNFGSHLVGVRYRFGRSAANDGGVELRDAPNSGAIRSMPEKGDSALDWIEAGEKKAGGPP